jgi:acyl-coenzyme A thioesterase PaaI-like protein
MSRHESAVPPGFVICRIADGRFAESVGPLYVHEGEPPRFGFLAEPRHGNVRESVHGGMLMTLADQVLGLTVMQAVGLETPVVTVSLHCDFVSAARPGEWIEGEATITRMTRSLIFVRGSLSHGRRVVLSAAGVWKKVRGAHGNGQGIGEHQA